MKLYGVVWMSHLADISADGIAELPVTADKLAAARYASEIHDPDDLEVLVEVEVSDQNLAPDEEAFYASAEPEEGAVAPATWRESLKRLNSAMAYGIPPGDVKVLGPVVEIRAGEPIFGHPVQPVRKFKEPIVTRILKSIFMPKRKLY